jgi:hypothetical protein
VVPCGLWAQDDFAEECTKAKCDEEYEQSLSINRGEVVDLGDRIGIHM